MDEQTALCRSSAAIHPRMAKGCRCTLTGLSFNLRSWDIESYDAGSIWKSTWDTGKYEILEFADGFGPDGPTAERTVETPRVLCKSSAAIDLRTVKQYRFRKPDVWSEVYEVTEEDIASYDSGGIGRKKWDAGEFEILSFVEGHGPPKVETKRPTVMLVGGPGVMITLQVGVSFDIDADGYVEFDTPERWQLSVSKRPGHKQTIEDLITPRDGYQIEVERVGDRVRICYTRTEPKVEAACKEWCGLPFMNGKVPSNGDRFRLNTPEQVRSGTPCYCTQACLDKAEASQAVTVRTGVAPAPKEPPVRRSGVFYETPKREPWKAPRDAHGAGSAYSEVMGEFYVASSRVAKLPDLPRDHHAPLKHHVPRWSTPGYVKPGRWK